MPSSPRICGLMLAYFKADMTLKCLRTLAGQGIETIMLVDNSHCPEEHQRTLQLVQHFPKGWLKVVIAEDNLGFAKGMNLALDHARQLGEWDYFLLLNNDITAKPDLVSQLVEYMQQQANIMLLGVHADAGDHLQGELYYQRLTGLMFTKPTLGSFPVVPGYCVLIQPTAISDHLFDPCYFMYGEDVELSWRMLQQGKKIAILPKPLLAHKSAQSSGEASLFYEYHINRGHWLIVQALGHNHVERIIMYTLRLLLLSARAVLRSWRFRSMTPLKALLMSGLRLPIRPVLTVKPHEKIYTVA